MPRPSGTTYYNWGTNQNTNESEPDNRFTNEVCAIANFTELAGPAETPYWGWDDKQCGRSMPFMCRLIREWLA